MTNNQFAKYRLEPQWRVKQQLFSASLNPHIADWLFDDSSLTERLTSCCPGLFNVSVLRQGWELPMINEARRLAMPTSRYGLVRQVQLLCGDQPVVYARTIIPPQTLRGRLRRLAHLGQRPLGAVLFADKSMRRMEMEFTRITPEHTLYATATRHLKGEQQEIWGRRSVFYLQRNPLLVSEIFLPTITTVGNCNR